MAPESLKDAASFLSFYEERLQRIDDRRYETQKKIEGNEVRNDKRRIISTKNELDQGKRSFSLIQFILC